MERCEESVAQESWNDDYADYRPAYEQRGKGLPRPLALLCGAVLVGGLGWTLFGSLSQPASAEVAETQPQNAATDADYVAPAASGDASALENAADALEAEGNAREAEIDAAASSDQGESSESATPVAAVAQPAVATISCRIQGMEVDAFLCVAPTGRSENGGYVKLSGGGSVRRYGPDEAMGLLSGRNARLNLPSDYELEIQSNGDDNYTLRVEVESGGNVVYQDEGSAYDTLRSAASSVS